jgi:predicted nucleic acid-binding protein
MSFMNGKCFVDTNVFVYYRDASEPEKQAVADDLLAKLWGDRLGRTGVQVLTEYYVTVTRKLSPGLSRVEAWRDVNSLLAWNPVPLTARLLTEAKELEGSFSLSWWDALIVATASAADCEILFSEDLQHGQVIDSVTVQNPFL